MTGECPDCEATLAPGAVRCRCGWVMQPAQQVVTPHAVPCDECGKPARRVGARLICQACEAQERHAVSEKFCAANGLVTREDKVAFCKRMARSFGRGPTFEQWAGRMTQATVEIIERMDGPASKTLERLRAEGVIDGRNKIIPVDARTVARDAYRAERARLIAQTHQELEQNAAARVPVNSVSTGSSDVTVGPGPAVAEANTTPVAEAAS